ncbi:MAG: 4-hydroxythreonine-4-phosphate dehydrogenase PdxA [Ignavibacteriales bacterium]|nr:MAG: 4-hydroxythreonine-4-phosphate dehydrogenase PdxA [Ignavibacteriales bacterium]
MKSFYFTCGDVNGIGPEITLKLFNRIKFISKQKIIFVCPQNIFEQSASLISPQFEYRFNKNPLHFEAGLVNIYPIKKVSIKIGKATKESGTGAYDSIITAFNFVRNDKSSALITSPISKTAFNLAGIKYKGHTDMIADWCKSKNYMMTFLSDKMKAALSTIHIPLKKVPKILTKDLITGQILLLNEMLKKDLGIKLPSIAVLGLNPHAGEDGLIGDEENKILLPAMNSLRSKVKVYGPFSPDAFFAAGLYKQFDLFLGLYHDQALIPFKMLNFAGGVNYTAGLPIVRTSPDHGVAYDIAWQNKADETSLFQAFRFADKILSNRMKNASAKK